MRSLSILTIILGSALLCAAQERELTQAEFDRAFRASYNIWTVWKGRAFRKTVSVENRGPSHSYNLSRVIEFDGKGASRAVYNEHVDGKGQRRTREVIGIGNSSYSRDLGAGGWSVRLDANREQFHSHMAYAPDPLEVQAVQAHFVRSRFSITSRTVSYAYAGTDVVKNTAVAVYKATERIAGIEKKSGLRMGTDAVMKYWFGADGMMLRSESVSSGHIGNDLYYLAITATWELDPSISINAPTWPPT